MQTIYCQHAGCQHAVVVDLLYLAGMTRRDDLRRIAATMASDDSTEVRCRQVGRMQFEGAIEYDSWGRS